MEKKKILFVCMGNICRSPAAEGVFKSLVEKENLNHLFEIDSAGTIGYHAGEQPDERMRKHAGKRGYNLVHSARKFNPDRDFDYFDYIITMDDENYYNVKQAARNNKDSNKIHKMIEYSIDIQPSSVPDPYYGGMQGFETVLNILEDASKGLLEKVKDELKQQSPK